MLLIDHYPYLEKLKTTEPLCHPLSPSASVTWRHSWVGDHVRGFGLRNSKGILSGVWTLLTCTCIHTLDVVQYLKATEGLN